MDELSTNLCDPGLPTTWHNLPKKKWETLVSATSSVSDKYMALVASEVRSTDNPVISNIPGSFRCNVSFDATWHRRGNYSNQGFASVIESESGKVIDYVLYQLIFPKCSLWPQERKDNNPEDYSSYWMSHKEQCEANYSGSSQGMEGSAAIEMWKR